MYSTCAVESTLAWVEAQEYAGKLAMDAATKVEPREGAFLSMK